MTHTDIQWPHAVITVRLFCQMTAGALLIPSWHCVSSPTAHKTWPLWGQDFVSWYLINSHLLCLDGNIMVHLSVEQRCWPCVLFCWSCRSLSFFPLRPWCILNSTWTSKCCVFNQKDISFIGNLLFIPGLPPVEQAERPFSFCFSWGL